LTPYNRKNKTKKTSKQTNKKKQKQKQNKTKQAIAIGGLLCESPHKNTF
jgi:hypothetical protein